MHKTTSAGATSWKSVLPPTRALWCSPITPPTTGVFPIREHLLWRHSRNHCVESPVIVAPRSRRHKHLFKYSTQWQDTKIYYNNPWLYLSTGGTHLLVSNLDARIIHSQGRKRQWISAVDEQARIQCDAHDAVLQQLQPLTNYFTYLYHTYTVCPD